MKTSRLYIECPECTRCAVDRVASAGDGSRHGFDRCNRCGHTARIFLRLPHDPNRFDSRPRLAGMILPTCREDLDA